MERKVGEEFNIKLKVVEVYNDSCEGCYFDSQYCDMAGNPSIGNCFHDMREDDKNVIFVEVREEK